MYCNIKSTSLLINAPHKTLLFAKLAAWGHNMGMASWVGQAHQHHLWHTKTGSRLAHAPKLGFCTP